MNKKVLKPLAFTAILLSFIISVVSCQMYSQADHYKKNGVAKRMSYLTFDVIYDANGGQGQMQTKGYTLGTEVGISGSAFTAPVGLKFHSWNTQPDGSGSMYNPGEKLIINSDDVTLYAIWIDKDAHAINYYNTKGVVGNNPYSFLESKTVELKNLSLDYYTFDGWYTNSSYTGNPVTGWEPGIYSTNVSLWAKWTAITYNVSYDYDGGTLAAGEYNRANFTVETSFTLKEPQKTGYNFDGWYDQGGNKITVLNSALAGQELVLTARYNIITYTITYYLYNGTNAVENPATYTVEDEITLATPTKTNRDFRGWYPTSARNGTPVTTIQKGTTGNLNLYARWKATGANTFDIDDEGIGNLSDFLNDVIDTSETDNAIAIAGDATTSELQTLSTAIKNKSQYIEELDLSELNVTEFYNSGGGDSGTGFMNGLQNVKKVILPDSLKILSEGAFYSCTNLEEVILNEGLTDMLWSAFCYCDNIREITIPDSVEFIAQTVFGNCYGLEKVNISTNSNLMIIGLGAFHDCTSLDNIYIPPKVIELDNIGATTSRSGSKGGNGSFYSCPAITTLKFSRGLTRIYNGTFINSNNISEVYYEGTEAEWRAINIGTNNGRLSNWEAEVAAGNLTMHFEAEYPLYP